MKRKTLETCRDIVEVMGEYCDGKLTPRLRREFERHLDCCPECVAFLETYRETPKLARASLRRAIPARMRDRLRAFIRTSLRAKR